MSTMCEKRNVFQSSGLFLMFLMLPGVKSSTISGRVIGYKDPFRQ